MAHNLNVAVRPAAMDARWSSPKMDFRSNEAGRTAPWKISRFPCGQNPFPVEPRQWQQELRRQI
jgi:hypothetical protein